MNQVNKILIGIIIILSVSVIYLIANRTPAKETVLSEESKSQLNIVKEDFMKAHIPAALTDLQKTELKLGAAAHKLTSLTFDITGGSFYFTPNEIRVKQGDKVKIIFTNVGGMHNLILDEFNVNTKTINTGESDTVEFTADKKGTFEFYCGVGKGYHRMMGQIGVLMVE